MSAVPTRARAWPPRVARADLLAVAIPTLVAALLCAIELNTRSFWVDEGSTFAITSQHGAALWRGIARDGGNMLLYYLLIHVVLGLFGSAAWVLRLPSLLAQAATAGLVAALGLRLLRDRTAALAAGLLSAVSLPLVYWGQNARGYALMVALGVASMLAFTMLVAPTAAGPRALRGEKCTPTVHFSPRVAVAYVLSTTAMLYVGYDAGLLILAQLALLPAFRERARALLGALAAVVILCIPLAVLALERGSGQLFWVPPLSGAVLGQAVQTLLSAGMSPSFHHAVSSVLTEIVTGVLLLAALVAGVHEARRPAGRRAHWRLWLLLSWLLVPVLVALIASAAGEPLELERCAILLIPALALLLAKAFTDPALPRAAGAVAFAVVAGLWLAQLLPSYGVSPENWKAATAYVLAAGRGTPACVAFYPQDGRETFDYYLREAGAGGRLTPVLPALPWGTVRPYVESYGTLDAGRLTAIERRCPRLYLVASHIGQSDGPPESRAHLRRYQRLQGTLARLYAAERQRSFGWAAPVEVTAYSRT